ncbi:MAG: hypothetical protein ACL7AX_07525 [Candidatus Arsenophonus phytopathogenicus]
MGFAVRSITNVLSYDKKKLPLFFVDLEPSTKIDFIFQIENQLHSKITIEEEPRKIRQIVQCHRCQKFGHTKNVCNLVTQCVCYNKVLDRTSKLKKTQITTWGTYKKKNLSINAKTRHYRL